MRKKGQRMRVLRSLLEKEVVESGWKMVTTSEDNKAVVCRADERKVRELMRGIDAVVLY